MKSKTLIPSLLALFLLVFAACDDDFTSVGLDTKPVTDMIVLHADTIYLGANYTQTIKANPVLIDPVATGFAYDEISQSRSNSFLLGSFHDKDYGSLKADFLTLFSPRSTLFNNNIIAIDTVELTLSYMSWLGDSIAPMVVSLYPAKKLSLADNFTQSDINLQQFSESSPWAKLAYTASNTQLTDSAYEAQSYYKLSFDISNKLMPNTGKDLKTYFLEEWNSKPATFETIASLERFFPGVYLTTNGGAGSLLKVHDVSLQFRYRFKYEGRDSSAVTFLSARNDIKQACQYIDNNQLPVNQLNLDKSYVKAPAGVYTQYTIPIKKIAQQIGDRKINTIKFSVTSYPAADGRYALPLPTTLLLVKKDSLNTFFTNKKEVQAPYAYKASLSNYVYDFGNLADLVREGIQNEPEKDVDMVLVPVVERSIYYSQYVVGTRTAYDITPSAATLRTDDKYLRLEILSSKIAK